MNTFLWPLLGAVISTIIAPICIVIAKKLDIVSRPRSDRWNTHATPLLGGAAIWGSLLVLSIIYSPAVSWPVIGLTLVFITGLIDDIRSIPPLVKTVAVSIAILVPLLLYAATTGSYSLQHIVSIYCWTLLLINSINLLDNINGLATASSLIACIFLVFAGNALALTDSFSLLFLAGALAGFLPYNFPKARIFMGDAGSMTIGYWIGVHSVSYVTIAEISFEAVLDYILPVLLFLIVPLADTAFVIFGRLARKQKISIGGKDHISHRLTAILGNSTYSVLALITLQILVSVGCISLLFYMPDVIVGYTIFVVLLVTVSCRVLLNRTIALTPDAA
jgi:UDP-GlcNAc:undecaprenyl-phosphate/decaprenyl-phosphate GlcNAc-1-phosphate transferase